MELFVPGSGSRGLEISQSKTSSRERAREWWVSLVSNERDREVGEKEKGRGLPVRKQLSRESRHLAARRLPGVSYIDLSFGSFRGQLGGAIDDNNRFYLSLLVYIHVYISSPTRPLYSIYVLCTLYKGTQLSWRYSRIDKVFSKSRPRWSKIRESAIFLVYLNLNLINWII